MVVQSNDPCQRHFVATKLDGRPKEHGLVLVQCNIGSPETLDDEVQPCVVFTLGASTEDDVIKVMTTTQATRQDVIQ